MLLALARRKPEKAIKLTRWKLQQPPMTPTVGYPNMATPTLHSHKLNSEHENHSSRFIG